MKFLTLPLAIVALAAASPAAGLRVLYYSSDTKSHNQAALNDLLGGDARFDLAGSRATAFERVSVADMLTFDVVLASAYFVPKFTGNELADYVDGGGQLVVASILGYQEKLGRFAPGRFGGAGYNPVASPTDDIYADVSIDQSTILASHPIMSGVRAISSGQYNGDYQTLAPGATLLVSWSNGRPLAAINALGNVRAITMYPNNVSGGPSHSRDYRRLLQNALAYQPVPEPASMAVLGLGLALLKRRRKG